MKTVLIINTKAMGKKNEGKFVQFTQSRFEDFKAKYNKAIEENKEEFVYDGEVYFVGYGKYLIEYLETHFVS